MGRRYTKRVREGKYIAEVEVEIIETGTGWSPYLSVEDANRLDDVRTALRRGDLARALNLQLVETAASLRAEPAFEDAR